MNAMEKHIRAALFCSVLLCWPGLAGSARAAYREAALTPSQEWAASLAGLLIERNGQRHEHLSPRYPGLLACLRAKRSIEEWWDISSREDLLNTLFWLENEGHRAEFEKYRKILNTMPQSQYSELMSVASPDSELRQRIEVVKKYGSVVGNKSILAWDFGRYVYLVRHGYMEGYITEREAWDRIMPVALRMQKTFSSWNEFGRNYLVGREFWAPLIAQKERDRYEAIFSKMQSSIFSPWYRHSWDMKLETASGNAPPADPAAREAEGYHRRGMAYAGKKEWEKAAAEFKKAVKADPQYVVSYSCLVEACMMQKKFDDAGSACAEAISNNPGQPYLYIDRGDVLWTRSGKFSDAVTNDFVAAIDIDPETSTQLPGETWGFDKYYYQRGVEALHAKNYRQAIRDFEVMLRISPQIGVGYYNIACCYALDKKKDMALKMLAIAIGLDRNFRKEAAEDKDFASLRYNLKFCAMTGFKGPYYIAGAVMIAVLGGYQFWKRKRKTDYEADEADLPYSEH